MSPRFEGQVGLGIEAYAKDDDGEEAGDVAGQLPVLPLPRLPRWWWSAVEEVAVRPILVAWTRPPVSSAATAGP